MIRARCKISSTILSPLQPGTRWQVTKDVTLSLSTIPALNDASETTLWETHRHTHTPKRTQKTPTNNHAITNAQRTVREAKQDEVKEIGEAKPLEPAQVTPEPAVEQPQPIPEPPKEQTQPVTQAAPAENVSSIEGLPVYDENAKKIGTAKQVGVDSNQTVVLLITKNDGSEGSVPWSSVGKVGDVILLGSVSSAPAAQPGKCSNCGFVNNEGSKFCEECGTKLQ